MTQSGDTVMPVILSGMTQQRVRARAWCITNFNDEVWHPANSVYDLMCQDTSKDGKSHFHQYLYFKNAISFNSIKKHYPTAHIQKEMAPGAYIDYIKGNANGRKTLVYEEGIAPKKHLFPTIREVREMTQEEREELPLQYFNVVSRLNAEENNDIPLDELYKPDIKVFYVYGASGAGKSRKAFELAKEHGYTAVNMVKFDGSFWHGVGKSECAIYDDFRDSHMKPSEFINFIDYNVHPLNVKGGSKRNHYKLIIFTSVQRPMEIYRGMPDDEPRKQWLRRMETVEIR